MRRADARVDDIGVQALAGIGLVDVLGRAGRVVRDGAKAPSRAVLRTERPDSLSLAVMGLGKLQGPDLVLLDGGNLP